MGLLIMPGGWPTGLAERFAELDDDRDLEREARRCKLEGHVVYTCPACGDVSCLRCLVRIDA